jgi:hypothetical protein
MRAITLLIVFIAMMLFQAYGKKSEGLDLKHSSRSEHETKEPASKARR